jgi:hypothetical protein
LRILGLDLLVKRDDRCGGNKPRSLESLLARHTERALCKIGEPAGRGPRGGASFNSLLAFGR